MSADSIPRPRFIAEAMSNSPRSWVPRAGLLMPEHSPHFSRHRADAQPARHRGGGYASRRRRFAEHPPNHRCEIIAGFRHLPRVISHSHAEEIVRQLDARSRFPARPATALAKAFQQLIRRLRVVRKFGPRPADVEKPMIVAPGRSRFQPRLWPDRVETMETLQPADFGDIQLFQQRLKHFTVRHAMRAVETFESVEEQQKPFDVPPIQNPILAIKRVRHRVGDAMFGNIRRQRVDIMRDMLHRGVIFRSDPPYQQMDLAAVFREIAGDFFTHQNVRRPGEFRGRRRWNRGP